MALEITFDAAWIILKFTAEIGNKIRKKRQ